MSIYTIALYVQFYTWLSLLFCIILVSFSFIFIKFNTLIFYYLSYWASLFLVVLMRLSDSCARFFSASSSDDKRFSRFSENFSGVERTSKCFCIYCFAWRNRFAKIDSVELFTGIIMTCAINCNISVGFHSSALFFTNSDVKSHICCKERRELCSRAAFTWSSISLQASLSIKTILL